MELDRARSLAPARLGFTPTSLEPIAEGDHFAVFLADDRWILRIAKGAVGSEVVPMEVRLLALIADRRGLAIPRIIASSFDEPGGMSYERLPGTQLAKGDAAERLGTEGFESSCAGLAGFLRSVHDVDVTRAAAIGVPDLEYPFGRHESGYRVGSAEALYREDLATMEVATFRFLAIQESAGTTVSLATSAGTQAQTQVLYLFAEDITGDLTGTATVVVGNIEPDFKRGDANNDGLLNIADPIWILSYLFQSALPPPCFDAGDANDDGGVDVGDPVYISRYLFTSGPAPSEPFVTCGPDPTPDALACAVYDHCP